MFMKQPVYLREATVDWDPAMFCIDGNTGNIKCGGDSL